MTRGPPRREREAMNGEIVWLNRARAYGFVRPADGGADIAFHLDGPGAPAADALSVGMAVHFTVRHDALGPLAHRLGPGHLDEEGL